MKKFISLVAMFAMTMSSACAASNHKYSFETKQFFHNNVQIEIIELRSQKAINDKYFELTGTSDRDGKTFAFSVINPNKTTCTIYIIDPKVIFKPEFLGHEVAHCIYGNFHPSE